MELPHYHYPNVKTILYSIYTKLVSFLKKAATLILCFSIIVWFLSYYPTGHVETSWLARAGQSLEGLASLMGADWRLLTSLFSSAVSKEAALATMGVIYNVPLADLPAALRAGVSPQGAFAFMCAQSLFMPCIATFGMIYRETGSFRLLAFIMAYTFVLPIVTAILVFQAANLVGGLSGYFLPWLAE